MIVESMKVLIEFEEKRLGLFSDDFVKVDREAVVAHASLHAWVSHWPSLKSEKMDELLKRNAIIYSREPGRWRKQRRMASYKLANYLRA